MSGRGYSRLEEQKFGVGVFLRNPLSWLKAFTWFADGLYIISSLFMLAGGFGFIRVMGAQVFTVSLGFGLALGLAVALIVGGLIALAVGLYKEYQEQKNIAAILPILKAKRSLGPQSSQKQKPASPKASKDPKQRKLRKLLTKLWGLGRSCYSGFKNAHRVILIVALVLIGLGLINPLFLTLPVGQLILPLIGCAILCLASIIEARVSFKRDKIKRASYKLNKQQPKELKDLLVKEKRRHKFRNLTFKDKARVILEALVDGPDGFYLVTSGLFLVTLLGGVILQFSGMGVGLALAFLLVAGVVSAIAIAISVNKELDEQLNAKRWKIRHEFYQNKLTEKNLDTKEILHNFNAQNKPKTRKEKLLQFIKYNKWARWVFCGLKNGHRSTNGLLVALVAFGLFNVANVASLGALGFWLPIAVALTTFTLTLVSSILKERRDQKIQRLKDEVKCFKTELDKASKTHAGTKTDLTSETTEMQEIPIAPQPDTRRSSTPIFDDASSPTGDPLKQKFFPPHAPQAFRKTSCAIL